VAVLVVMGVVLLLVLAVAALVVLELTQDFLLLQELHTQLQSVLVVLLAQMMGLVQTVLIQYLAQSHQLVAAEAVLLAV